MGIGQTFVQSILEITELFHVGVDWLVKIGKRIDARLKTVDLRLEFRLDPALMNSWP